MAEDGIVRYSQEAIFIAAVCAVMFCIVGVFGNIVTILALTLSKKLKPHATTAFVLSLCISDLLFCAVNLPLTAARYAYKQWILGDFLCKIFPVIFYGNVAVSVLNIMAITINRYILISFYAYYRKLYSKLSISVQLFCTWVIAFLIMVPPLIGVWGQLGLDPSTFSCTILEKDGKSPKKIIFLIGFVLPCFVIILGYSCIYYTIRKADRNLRLNQSFSPQTRSRREQHDRRLTKAMALIFFCFLLCFLPLMLVNVLDDLIPPIFHVLASILAWASSVINPIIYAASNSQYRYAYIELYNKALCFLPLANKKPRCSRSVLEEGTYRALGLKESNVVVV